MYVNIYVFVVFLFLFFSFVMEFNFEERGFFFQFSEVSGVVITSQEDLPKFR
jgi:hypothetical protein